MRKSSFSIVFLTLFVCAACSQKNVQGTTTTKTNKKEIMQNLETATFCAGCFWCIEAVFQDLQGVESVQSGYSNGKTENPTYKEVCSGTTGHAEVLEIKFDPAVITYEELLEILWYAHDPTTLNRQGADVGTQYRSGIYYHNEEQKIAAEKAKVAAQAMFEDPIVTEIEAAETFYPAEDYHTDYFKLHGEQPYCSAVIAPKVKKVKTKFADKMKK